MTPPGKSFALPLCLSVALHAGLIAGPWTVWRLPEQQPEPEQIAMEFELPAALPEPDQIVEEKEKIAVEQPAAEEQEAIPLEGMEEEDVEPEVPEEDIPQEPPLEAVEEVEPEPEQEQEKKKEEEEEGAVVVPEREEPVEVSKPEPEPTAEPEKARPVAPPAKTDEAAKAMLLYQSAVKQRIQRALRYPRQARRKGLTGVTKVQLGIRRNGSLAGAIVVEKSASSVLDRAALNAVRHAAPFGPVPGSIEGATIHMGLDVVFQAPR